MNYTCYPQEENQTETSTETFPDRDKKRGSSHLPLDNAQATTVTVMDLLRRLPGETETVASKIENLISPRALPRGQATGPEDLLVDLMTQDGREVHHREGKTLRTN